MAVSWYKKESHALRKLSSVQQFTNLFSCSPNFSVHPLRFKCNADLKKFFKPTVNRGKIVWPKTQADLLKYGVRWDYDGVVKEDGNEYHKYQLQPNAGKIPSSIKQWRDKNGGTHAVMTTLYLPKGVEHEAVVFEEAMEEAIENIP